MKNVNVIEITWGKPLRGAFSILQTNPRSLFKKRLYDFGIGDVENCPVTFKLCVDHSKTLTRR